MSADNGIYVLILKDQCRVVEAMAIDNLNWSLITNRPEDEYIPTRVYEYFHKSEPMTYQEALDKAFRLEDEIYESDFPILEYGISIIEIDKTWDEILKEAKDLYPKEIKSVKNDYRWNDYIESMKENYSQILRAIEIKE